MGRRRASLPSLSPLSGPCREPATGKTPFSRALRRGPLSPRATSDCPSRWNASPWTARARAPVSHHRTHELGFLQSGKRIRKGFGSGSRAGPQWSRGSDVRHACRVGNDDVGVAGQRKQRQRRGVLLSIVTGVIAVQNSLSGSKTDIASAPVRARQDAAGACRPRGAFGLRPLVGVVLPTRAQNRRPASLTSCIFAIPRLQSARPPAPRTWGAPPCAARARSGRGLAW